MSNFHGEIAVTSTLGKRKVNDVNDGHPSTLSITITKRIDRFGTTILGANVWVEDEEKRRFAMKFDQQALADLQQVIAQAFADD